MEVAPTRSNRGEAVSAWGVGVQAHFSAPSVPICAVSRRFHDGCPVPDADDESLHFDGVDRNLLSLHCVESSGAESSASEFNYYVSGSSAGS